MRVPAAALALLTALAVAGCGAQEGGGEAARHLDPRSDAVFAVDLDYDGANWEQIKRLYARVIESGALEGQGFVPPTLDGALGAAAASAGLSFPDDVKPLLGGTLYAGLHVEPAEPLSAGARHVLERLDEDATRFGRSGPRYVDRDGRPMDETEVNSALEEEARREPEFSASIAYQVEDPDALERVIEKLRGQGLREQPIPDVDAVSLTDGVAVAGGDTIVVALGSDGPDDRLLRERLAQEEGARAPELDGAFVAARARPALLGAVLDREELRRALATDAGAALRGAEADVRLEEDAARADARIDFEGLPDEQLPLPPSGPLELPVGQAVVSGSANQSITTVFLARLARELYPESRFVRRVEALEQREALRFEDEVLKQFTGPSFTVLRPFSSDDFEFGARSTLRDPTAMRYLLPRIAPRLPGILEALPHPHGTATSRPTASCSGRARDATNVI